ncbi:MAG: S41 family peptidase [Firmicutes bacterium HGW-Firmicutes-15]|nr:MAG: S41 family peptidase [Firmicutes bacterium HGW-Firmicutes-15]
MKDNKIFRGFTIFFSILGLLVFLSVGFVFATNSSGLSSMLSVMGLIKAESLYTPHSDKMIEGATAGIVASLNDPYSKYLNKNQWQELKLQLNAEFGGIGVYVVEMEGGKLTIVSPIKGTPAARAGLKNGDIITKINGESAVGMNQDDAVQLMRGDPGTQLELSVFRTDDSKEYDFKIVREIINVPSVEDKIVSDIPLLGYIKLNQFHARSAQEIATSVNKMEDQKIKGLILDLRDNGGGDFDAALAIADIFLDKQEVVSVKDAKGVETVHNAGVGSYNAPLIVLVNKNSASASEILAGALQDNGRAVLVGEKTYGKGLVQTVYPLRDGGALKLTTQKYFTPKGTDINQIGINPDHVVTNPDKGNKDLQLERAIELLKQKTQ